MTAWTRRKVGNLIDGLTAGVSVRSSVHVRGGPAILKTSAVDRGRFIPSESKTILPADLPRARCNPVADSLIISRMNTPAMVGDVGYVDEAHEDLFLPDRLWLARAKRGSGANMRWLTYYFASEPGARELRELASGTSGSMKNIPKGRVLALEIDTPTDGEQRAIATALADVDGLISSLEKVVAKKHCLKQGMMQQLLSGKTRLPGHTGPWVERLLGNVTRIKTGSRNNQDKKVGGAYPFFVRSQTVERIDSYSYNCEAILVPGEGGIGSIFHYINGKFEVHQRVYKISDFATWVSGRFVYYYMRQYFGVHAMENSVKATVDSLRLPTFKNFVLQLPSHDEQSAIVDALDGVEAELHTLEARLAKARAVQCGMMQELLTGRTRLTEEVAS